jgi:hypothetical protein
MTVTEQILRFLGGVVAYGGGAVAIAFLFFRFLSKSWLENKFAQKLEQFKHQQALEIQRLRVEIDSMLSGVLKIQEKEFETLPEAWCKLDEAYGRVSALAAPLQQYPDLEHMTAVQLEEFLGGSELLESQKADVRNSTDRLKTYQDAIFWHKLHTVKKACADLHNYVARWGIFFPLELKEKFARISEELWSSVSSVELGHQFNDYRMRNEGWKKTRADVEPLYKAIESDIQARLHSHGRSQ